jgi:hypothetical protein
LTVSLITILSADKWVDIDKDGVRGSVIAFLPNVINVPTFVCALYRSGRSTLSPMLSRYCWLIAFDFPHLLPSSPLEEVLTLPVAYELLIALPGKESHLRSLLQLSSFLGDGRPVPSGKCLRTLCLIPGDSGPKPCRT